MSPFNYSTSLHLPGSYSQLWSVWLSGVQFWEADRYKLTKEGRTEWGDLCQRWLKLARVQRVQRGDCVHPLWEPHVAAVQCFPSASRCPPCPILSKVGGVFSYLFTTKFRCHHKSQNFVHTRKHIFVWEGVRLIKVRLKYHVYFGGGTAHICHNCHNRRWCSFFPQRMWNQQPYSENKSPTLHTFVMKLTDTSSKIPNAPSRFTSNKSYR